MSFAIPPKGTMPTNPKDENYERDMLAYKEQMAARNLAIQTLMEEQTQQQAMRTNLAKSSHDALMSIINNFKG